MRKLTPPNRKTLKKFSVEIMVIAMNAKGKPAAEYQQEALQRFAAACHRYGQPWFYGTANEVRLDIQDKDNYFWCWFQHIGSGNVCLIPF